MGRKKIISRLYKKDTPDPMIKKLAFLTIVVLGISIIVSVVWQKPLNSKSQDNQARPDLTTTPNSDSKNTNSPTSPLEAGTTYFVDPILGDDTNNGLSKNTSFKTIQKALFVANPSDVVSLANGVYMQNVVSVRDGAPDAPITIRGEKQAIVKGSGGARVIEINHSFISLEGFSVDGLIGDPGDKKNYRDKLIYVLGKQPNKGVTGLSLSRMMIKNAGGECIRLRYFATGNEISYNIIGPCGAFDFKFESDNKNGEGIYVGTSSEQWGDGKNPTKDADKSTKNYIHHNTINTQGNECVDIKEGSAENIIEYNSCTGQLDSESGGFDARGDRNIFRYNITFGNRGAGIRLGGHTVAGVVYGLGNDVFGNTFKQNREGGLKIETEPQGKICGNDMSENGSREKFGSKADDYVPSMACS